MSPPGGPLTLDTASGMPIYRQIVDWVTVRVAGGQLQPGEQLPTVRQMAVDLHVNYNTVARAYMELERMSVVNTLQGKGTFVAEKPAAVDELVRATKLRGLINEFLAKVAEFGFTPQEVTREMAVRVPDFEREDPS